MSKTAVLQQPFEAGSKSQTQTRIIFFCEYNFSILLVFYLGLDKNTESPTQNTIRSFCDHDPF